MEPMEAISEAQWSSLSGIYITEEDFMAQLLQNIDLDLGSGSASELGASAWSCNNETSFYAPNSANCFPQTSCYSNAVTFPNVSGHDHGNYHYLNPMTPNRVPEGSFLSIHSADIEGDGYLNHDELKEEEHPIEEKVNSWRKRSRSTGNVHGLKRNVKMKKSQSVDLLSTCCSENADSSGSQQKNGGSMETPAVNLSGKTQATRGSATDLQSIYARKRRERINERLKTLQSLVPNGTKVDISTMLEEAVHYVKLLQLQIKLLSSDDHWMYAPIAYNGIDIGLDLRIKTQR